MNLVASIAQAIITTILNMQFKKIAVYTANLENHRQQKNHDRSIFIKRFIFEFTDFQLYLFYIGIYQQHLTLLRTNLVAVFMVDEIRRIICESVLPYLMQNKQAITEKAKVKL